MQGKIEMLLITVGSAVAGTVAPIGAELSKTEIPFIVVQLFQIGSYATAIIVGCVTLYKFKKGKK